MTTRRNNMFYYRGACSAYKAILTIMKEIKSDDEREKVFQKLYNSWLKGADAIIDNSGNPEIDSRTIFTEHFYVTVRDNKYVITDEPINNITFNRIILWSGQVLTNYIIDFTGDLESVTNFIDSDEEFRINLPKTLGINPNEVEEIYNPKVICVL